MYHTIIEATRCDDRVKDNYLPMALSGVARSWLINLPEGTIYNWDKLYAMFIGNFQGTYERPSTIETLKTVKQMHDESLWDYVNCFTLPGMLFQTSRTSRSSMPSEMVSLTSRLFRKSP
jgi:hypothetical protein